MSSHSYDCVEMLPVGEDSSSSVDLEQLVREISLAISEHVLLSGDQGVFISELNHKIRSVSQQLASLTD